jgi:hypothetical protein
MEPVANILGGVACCGDVLNVTTVHHAKPVALVTECKQAGGMMELAYWLRGRSPPAFRSCKRADIDTVLLLHVQAPRLLIGTSALNFDPDLHTQIPKKLSVSLVL